MPASPCCVSPHIFVTVLTMTRWDVPRLLARRYGSILSLTGVTHVSRLEVLCRLSMFVSVGLGIARMIPWAR